MINNISIFLGTVVFVTKEIVVQKIALFFGIFLQKKVSAECHIFVILLK